MSKAKDLTGQTFGRLTVIGFRRGSRENPPKWECKCSCGQITFVKRYKLTSGHTRSCGCLHSEIASVIHRTHGLRRTRLYQTWCNMKQRCYNKNNTDYHSYGGRGITICDEWLNDFKAFYDWSMSHGYRDDLTIDRINVDKGYSPDNCRWETNARQAINKCNTVKIIFNGESWSLKELCEKYDANYQKAYDELIRYRRVSPEEFFLGKRVV